MHKTGSTSIQHFLSRRRRILPLFGVRYPRSFGADGRSQPKHNAIFTAISHEADFGAPHPILGPSARLVEQVARDFADSRASLCILSAEGFSGERPDFARALTPLRDSFDVSVIVFLRRPDIWLEKFHRQMILSREVRETRGIAEFMMAPETQRHLDYPAILGWWADAFGPDALRVEPYREDGDVLRRFLEVAELPSLLKVFSGTGGRLNQSPDIETVLRTLRANRGGGSAAPSELILSDEAKRELSSRLQMAWNRSDNVDVQAFSPPSFIFSMLEHAE